MNPASIIAKNQFGEQSNLSILGGSSQIWCKFVVDSTNVNGLGLRSLVSSGLNSSNPDVVSVFMNTNQTPGTGSPNPAAGVIQVNFSKAFSSYINGFTGFVSPQTGTPINVTSGLTQHVPYVIASLGTTTAAQWQTLGLPANQTPAIGVCFIAITASAGSGTGTVQALKVGGSALTRIEILGDPNASANPLSGGAQMILGCYGGTPIGTNNSATPAIFTGAPLSIAAPADETVIRLAFSFANDPAPLI